MNTRLICPWMAMAFVLLIPALGLAEDRGWSFPNLNPFSSKGQPPTASRGKSGGSWLPKLWPSTTAARRPTNEPTSMQKMTTATKRFFSKTADALNPWDDANDNRTMKPSGSGSAFSRTAAKPKSESSSFLSPASWWSSDDKPARRDKTVNDFLSRPRPDF